LAVEQRQPEKEDTMSQTSFNHSDYHGTGPENYERFFVPAIGKPLALDLIAAARLEPGQRILDVACGTGVVTRLAAKQVGERGTVAGLDVNPGMLSVARAATPENMKIDWYETSAEAMPLPDRAFDVILCQMGLQFVPNMLEALAEMRRLLEPGGRVVLNLPGPTPAPFSALADALARHIKPECAGFVGMVFSLHDADELGKLMADAGFVDVLIHKATTTLRLPAPEDFLWQYIHSTPLAGLVAQATEKQRAALRDDVVTRWREFAADGGLDVTVPITTVSGTSQPVSP
jgi:ubiquinone/menaquinone biosynthesis C-methylase UbiE